MHARQSRGEVIVLQYSKRSRLLIAIMNRRGACPSVNRLGEWRESPIHSSVTATVSDCAQLTAKSCDGSGTVFCHFVKEAGKTLATRSCGDLGSFACTPSAHPGRSVSDEMFGRLDRCRRANITSLYHMRRHKVTRKDTPR